MRPALRWLICTLEPPAEAPAPPTMPAIVRYTEGRTRLDRELERCATLTMPDSGCEAAWAENRRRFFRQGDSESAGR